MPALEEITISTSLAGPMLEKESISKLMSEPVRKWFWIHLWCPMSQDSPKAFGLMAVHISYFLWP